MNRLIKLLLKIIILIVLFPLLLLYLIFRKRDKREEWALAVGAQFVHRFEGHQRDLHLVQDGDDYFIENKNVLRRDWGISDRQEATSTLNWLFEEGHAAEFARAPNEKYSHKDALAFDLVRLNYLSRSCACYGYITDDEAWEYVYAAAKTAQETYTSWNDLTQCYLRGREYWAQTPAEQWLLDELEQTWSDPECGWHLSWNEFDVVDEHTPIKKKKIRPAPAAQVSQKAAPSNKINKL